jgi:NADH-quinone oxidoreductase subunit H
MAEYINMITVSSVAATLFFGGWSFFGLTDNIPGVSIVIYLIKVAIFLFFFIWLRATLPRIRYDRLMRLGWQLLLPLAVLNVVITATCVALNLPWWVCGLAGLAVIVVFLVAVRRKSFTEGTRFEEKRGKGDLVLPSSVRLVKFEKITPQVEGTLNGTSHTKQEQDMKSVRV